MFGGAARFFFALLACTHSGADQILVSNGLCSLFFQTYRRKFRSQTSDNMKRWISRGGKSQGREEKRREEERRKKKEERRKKKEDQRRERVRRQKMQVREKVVKIAKHSVFPMICGSGGSKSRLAKAAAAEPSGQMRDEKLHAAVARSTFPSQNAQNTTCSDHFWKLRC